MWDFPRTTRKQKEGKIINILFMDDDAHDDLDLSLLRACEAHLVRLENQRRDLSEDSPFVHRIMGVDPSVVEAMRRDTEKDWTLSTRPGENSEQNHQRLGMVGE